MRLTGLDRWLPAIIGTACLLPFAVVAVQLLYVRRLRRGVPGTRASRTAWLDVAMVATTAPWIWMILTPVPGDRQRYLVPLSDLWEQLHHPPGWVAMQIGGNLAVFAGFGLLAPVRWRIRPLWIVLLAAAGSATVETAQWFLDIGRVASVDDVLVNAAGAGLASLLSRPWWARRAETGTPAAPITGTVSANDGLREQQ
jgi:hypothetical protein